MFFADCSCMHQHPAPTPPQQEIHAPVSHQYKTIDTEGLKNLMNAKIALTILDARSGEWDDGNRIPGAKTLDTDATAEQAAAVIPSKESLVVAYCTNLHCPASKALAEHLLELGYTNVVKYAEGIEQWMAAGNEIAQAQ